MYSLFASSASRTHRALNSGSFCLSRFTRIRPMSMRPYHPSLSRHILIKKGFPSQSPLSCRKFSSFPSFSGAPKIEAKRRRSLRKTIILLYSIPLIVLYQSVAINSFSNTYLVPSVTNKFIIGAYTFHYYAKLTNPKHPLSLDLDSFESTMEFFNPLASEIWATLRHLSPAERAVKAAQGYTHAQKLPDAERHAMMRSMLEDVLCLCRQADSVDVRGVAGTVSGSHWEGGESNQRVTAWGIIKVWWLGRRVTTRMVVGCHAMDMRVAGIVEPREGILA